MALYCQCKKCKENFMDMFGEFTMEGGLIKCPNCGSTEMIYNKDIPNFKKITFNCYNHYVKKYK